MRAVPAQFVFLMSQRPHGYENPNKRAFTGPLGSTPRPDLRVRKYPRRGTYLYFLTTAGSGGKFCLVLPYPRRDSGIKTPKNDQKRQPTLHRNHKTAKLGGCAAKCTLPSASLKTRDLAGRRTCTLRFCQLFLTCRSGGRANSAIFKVRDFACFCGSKYAPSI